MEILSLFVWKIFIENVEIVIYIVVFEKYRLREDNKRGVFKVFIGICKGFLGYIFVSDVV